MGQKRPGYFARPPERPNFVNRFPSAGHQYASPVQEARRYLVPWLLHYMATNSYGGRTQSWIGYDVNLISGNYRVTVGEDNLSQHECPVGKKDTVLNVTDKVLDQASRK